MSVTRILSCLHTCLIRRPRPGRRWVRHPPPISQLARGEISTTAMSKSRRRPWNLLDFQCQNQADTYEISDYNVVTQKTLLKSPRRHGNLNVKNSKARTGPEGAAGGWRGQLRPCMPRPGQREQQGYAVSIWATLQQQYYALVCTEADADA